MRSAMRSEVDVLANAMRQEMRVLASQVDKARVELRTDREAFENSRKFASSREWLLLMPNGRYCCGVCTTHCALLIHLKQRESPFILANGGIRYTSDFASQICVHEDSKMHALSLENERNRSRNPLHFSVQVQLLESREITAKLFRTVSDCAIHYRSFLDYESLVVLQHCNDLQIGDQLHSRNTAVQMVSIMYDSDRGEYTVFLCTINPATGRLPTVGSSSDKVSDKKFKQWQVTTGRVNFIGSPITWCVELRKMGETSKGVDCHEQWIAALNGYKVQPIQRRTYASDGEAVYYGDGNTADTVKSLVLAEDPMNEYIQDPPHANELLKEDMHYEFPYICDIHEFARQVYSHLSCSGKKTTGMEVLAEKMGVTWKELHYIFDIRMVESEYIAISNLMSDYPVIVASFRGTISAAAGQSDTVQISQIKHWLRRMTEFKFVAVALNLLDYDKRCKIFSKAGQSDTALAHDYPTAHDQYKASLTVAAAGHLGSHCQRNLASLRKGKYAGVVLRGVDVEVEEATEHSAIDPDHFEVEAIVAKKKSGRGHAYMLKWLNFADSFNTWEAAGRIKATAPQLVAAFERGDSAEQQQATARECRTARRAAFKEPEESTSMFSGLSDGGRKEAEAAIEKRLKSYAAAMAAATLRHFDTRLPVPPVLLHLRSACDFRRMPWHDNSQLLSWSDDSVRWLVENKFPELDVAIVQAEALKVRLWLREHKDQFYVDAPVHDDHGDPIKNQTKKVLAICGIGSINHTLFTRYNELFPSGIQSYLVIADYGISFMFSSCSTERIGRNMTLTKPPERSSLLDDNFKKLVWLSYNSPPIHQVDFTKYVRIWEGGKHQLALFKEGGCPQVLGRKLSERKHTILARQTEGG